MAVFAKRVGRKQRYRFLMPSCIGYLCFAPGMYQHRGATGSSGSRNTGQETGMCMTQAYHGCPGGHKYSKDRAALRREDGWRIA